MTPERLAEIRRMDAEAVIQRPTYTDEESPVSLRAHALYQQGLDIRDLLVYVAELEKILATATEREVRRDA